MIADAGFEVEGTDQVTLPEHRAAGGCHDGGGCGSDESGGVCGSASDARVDEPRTDLVAVRRRGAGTDLAPNA